MVLRDALCSSADKSHDAVLDLYHCRFALQIELVEAEEIIGCWSP